MKAYARHVVNKPRYIFIHIISSASFLDFMPSKFMPPSSCGWYTCSRLIGDDFASFQIQFLIIFVIACLMFLGMP